MNVGSLRALSYPAPAPVFPNYPSHPTPNASHYPQLSSAPSHPDVPQMQGLPTPLPSIGYDVTEFRHFFRFGLQQLIYNNKYIINDLTTLASVYQHRMSPFIVRDIDSHIRESDPKNRLVAFYVIDSICKNLGHPYPELFKPTIEHLFLTAYRALEDHEGTASIKVKFEELLGTWRTGSARGAALFGSEVQQRIEDGVFGRWRRGADMIDSQAFLSGMNQQPAVATPAEKASILYDLRRILGERERIACSYAPDPANLTQIVTLQKLEHLVANQQLTINQVEDIRQQLQPLKPTTPPAIHPSEMPLEHGHYQLPMDPVAQSPAFDPPTIGELTDPNSLANLTRLFESNPSLFLQQSSKPDPSALPSTHSLAAMLNSVAHLQGAMSISALQVPVPPSNGVPSAAPTASLFDSDQLAAALASLRPPPLDPNPTADNGQVASAEKPADSALPKLSPAPSNSSRGPTDPNIQDYEEYVLSLGIELTTSSINRVDPSVIMEVLYSRIPQYCRQDGSRFLEGPTGDSRASTQLDAHFRLHRRVLEQQNRPQQRMWCVLEADWVKSHDFGVEHEQRKKDKSVDETPESIAAGKARATSELKQKTVLRPTDPVEANGVCPICQEPFETKFDEDEEEYHWLNAIEMGHRNGATEGVVRQVYHATCHFEAMTNKARLELRREEEEANARKLKEENMKKVKLEEEAEAEAEAVRQTLQATTEQGGSSSSDGESGLDSILQIDEDFFASFANQVEGDGQGSSSQSSVVQDGLEESADPSNAALTKSQSNKRKNSNSESSDDHSAVNGTRQIEADASFAKKKSRVIFVE